MDSKSKKFNWYDDHYTLPEFIKETLMKLIFESEDGKRLMGDSNWKSQLLGKLGESDILKVELVPCCDEDDLCNTKPCSYSVAETSLKDAEKQFSNVLDKILGVTDDI